MITYKYECLECSHEFEIKQKISDGKLTDCPICNKNTLERVPQLSSFSLKGSDWYSRGKM